MHPGALAAGTLPHTFWKDLLNLSYDGLALTQQPFIFSRMEQQPTPHETVWLLFGTVRNCYLSFRRHLFACSVTWPYWARFFPVGVPERPAFRRRIMTFREPKKAIVDEVAAVDEDLQTRVYGNFQTRLQQRIDVNWGLLPDAIFSKWACNLWVINSILGRIYTRFRLFFPISIYYLWPFEMCQSAPPHPVFMLISLHYYATLSGVGNTCHSSGSKTGHSTWFVTAPCNTEYLRRCYF